MATFWELMRDVIPDDHARQVDAGYYVHEVMTSPEPPRLVVDVGCGTGSSAAEFGRYGPVRWVGVDISDSMEAQAREPGSGQVVYFDGVRLPFPSGSLELVFSRQALEHVRHPEDLLREIRRVLRPGGLLIGSTSQLEPYHSRSIWNFTVYGFRMLVEDAGLQLDEVRPGIDGVTLTRRSFEGRPPEYARWFTEESPINAELDHWGRGKPPARVNNRKLQYCGHFAFRVRRPVLDGTP